METAIPKRLATIFCALALLAAFVFSAWVSDDALIAFRSAANMIDGFGLRWNVHERVQSFTSPVWTVLIALLYGVSNDLFIVPIACSVLLSLACVWLILRPLAPIAQLIVTLCFITSNSLIDFSTSGLENPLLHLLIALFFLRHTEPLTSAAQLRQRLMLISFILLTRHDALMIIFPSAAWYIGSYLLEHRGEWRTLFAALFLGTLPFILWSAFSFFYYGAPLPNTAYAKLSMNIPLATLASQGWEYLKFSARQDTATALLIAVGIFISLYQRQQRLVLIALGILLQTAYILRVGGDFMQGRFFSVIALAAIVAIALALKDLPQRTLYKASGVTVAAVLFSAYCSGISALQYKIFVSPDFMQWYFHWCPGNGYICDERGIYFDRLGLLPVLARGEREPECLKQKHLWQDSEMVPPYKVVKVGAAGEAGFYEARNTYLLDPMALSDPLLARLPALPTAVRPGHYERKIPRGYEESLRLDQNLLESKRLHRMYREIRLLTRRPLFDRDRLACLARKLACQSCAEN